MGTNGGRRACLVLDSSTSRSGVGSSKLVGEQEGSHALPPSPSRHAKDTCKAPSSAGPGRDHLRGRGLVPPPRRNTASLCQLRAAGLEEDGCGVINPWEPSPKARALHSPSPTPKGQAGKRRCEGIGIKGGGLEVLLRAPSGRPSVGTHVPMDWVPG